VTNRLAGEGRYAKLEREQRWVLHEVPAGTTEDRAITDDYLVGTRLRLREIQSDSETIFKLCQKIRLDEGDPERIKITNFYISAEEYNQMLALPTLRIVKTRRTLSHADAVYAIDQFPGRHSGLVLAERELSVSEPSHDVPVFASFEVTGDNRYSGGCLAFASDEELRQLIRQQES
jgi:CYTH domain-containing protein